MRSPDQPTNNPPDSAPLHGVLAEFSEVDPLIRACKKVRDAGYTRWDAHTPFPVHGLDDAMGVRPTKLPWFILLCGLTGLSGGLLLQYWTMAIDYPFRISGKPLFSLPAFVPVCFELTVLCSAFAAIFGCLGLSRLPNLFNPLFRNARFRRVTNDKFFVFVQAADPKFERGAIETMFGALHAESIEPVHFDAHAPENNLPSGTTGIATVLVALSLVPFALFARARETISELPRIHANPPAPVKDDMDRQYKFKPQAPNWFFNDRRAMRAWPQGTLAEEDPVDTRTAFLTGKEPTTGGYVEALPAGVRATAATMHRGEERFGVYCAPCHGLSGHGDGLVARRAEQLQQGTWVAPTSLHDDRVRKLPLGDIYNTVAHGVRNMPPYGHLIEPDDRWAIVMYVRALQLSQNAPQSAVPADVLPGLQ
jgi:mono/diheme cytochrome c family protein